MDDYSYLDSMNTILSSSKRIEEIDIELEKMIRNKYDGLDKNLMDLLE